MNKNIEIEVRGPLSKAKYSELIKLFRKKGKLVTEKNRVLIDYSTFLKGGIRNRKKDIRLRVTNGIPEIIVKLGKWGGLDQRKELSVTTKPGEFDTLVQIFAALGLHKGTLCIRKSKVYMYQDIEFALVEVPGHSYYYEAEIMASKNEDTKKLVKKIQKTCSDLGLEIFDRKKWFSYVDRLNQKANEIFNYSKYKTDYFKKRFKL